MIALRGRSLAVVRRRRRSNSMTIVVSVIVPRVVVARAVGAPVVPRVVCAWWGPVLIPACATATAAAIAVVWTVVVSLAGRGRRWFVVVGARGAGARGARGCPRHCLGCLITNQLDWGSSSATSGKEGCVPAPARRAWAACPD